MRFQFLATKAFGDFVIAATVLDRVERSPDAGLCLLAGSHLRELALAVKPLSPIAFFDSGEPTVPALFDWRRKGSLAALRSAGHLRRTIARSKKREAILVLDRSGIRERALAWPARAKALPSADNIYRAYSGFLAGQGYPLGSSVLAPFGSGDEIGIFPASRLRAKELTIELVREVCRHIVEAGATPVICLLEGERPDILACDLPHRVIQRTFTALAAQVGALAGAVSADSLPAHLAERAGIPIFVFTPRDNRYWLPLSSFDRRRWSLASAAVDTRFRQFVSEVTH